MSLSPTPDYLNSRSSTPLSLEEEHLSEEEEKVLPRTSPQTIVRGDETSVRSVVTSVFEAIHAPAEQREKTINRLDEEGRFLRYSVPSLSLADYMSVPEIAGLYNGVIAGLYSYHQNIGCYALIKLVKFREQCEDDYKEISQEFYPCPQNTLHTHAKRDWLAVFDRMTNPDLYLQESQQKKAEQIEGIEKIVSRWKQTGLFELVFAPPPVYRIETLKECPGAVACSDKILLVYKSLPPIHKFGSNVSITPVDHPSGPPIDDCTYFETRNRSLLRRTLDTLPSLPSRNSITQQLQRLNNHLPSISWNGPPAPQAPPRVEEVKEEQAPPPNDPPSPDTRNYDLFFCPIKSLFHSLTSFLKWLWSCLLGCFRSARKGSL